MKKVKLFLAILMGFFALTATAQVVENRQVFFNNYVKIKAGTGTTNRLLGVVSSTGYLNFITLSGGLSLANNVLSSSGGSDSTNFWNTRGNSVSSAARFIGTTNARGFNIKTNSVLAIHVDSAAIPRVGINTGNPAAGLDVAASFRDSVRQAGLEYIINSGKTNRFGLSQALYTLNPADSTVYGLFQDNSTGGKVILAWQDAGAPTAPEYEAMMSSNMARLGYAINNTTFVRGVTVDAISGTTVSGETTTGINMVWADGTDTPFATMRNSSFGIGNINPQSAIHVTDGDVYVDNNANGLIQKSPDGSCWRITVSDLGVITAVSITCP